MKLRLPLFLVFTLASSLPLLCQSEKQRANYLQRFPEADANSDGVLSAKEARVHRQKGPIPRRNPREASDPSEGDNRVSQSRISGIDIPESHSPVKEVKLKSLDGVDLSFAYRSPSGPGPHPAILFFHGGGGQSNLQGLKNNLRSHPIHTRFLEKGYLTIASTRRPYWKNKDNTPNGFYDAVQDAALVVEKAKTLPGVDPSKVVLYGGSGGAILAIATASKVGVACVIAGEPATVVPLAPKKDQSATPADYRGIMEDPTQSYTPERQREMRSWMTEIDCPILLLQGNHVGLYKTNFEILIPEMNHLGKDISSIHYSGVTHGFYWGTAKTGATLDTVESIMSDVIAFIETHTRH